MKTVTVKSSIGWAMVFIAGVCLGIMCSSLPKAEADARVDRVKTKTVQFMKTANMTTPEDESFAERWEDPEYGIVCYVSSGSSFSCVKK